VTVRTAIGATRRICVSVAKWPCAAFAFVLAITVCASSADARSLFIGVGDDAAAVVRAANAGDTVEVASGVHAGPLRIEKPIVLRGLPGAVVDGGGRGTVIEVVAPGAVIEDLAVRGSGDRALTIDSGIHVVLGHGVAIQRVHLTDVLYGIYCERANGVRIEDCMLEGRVTPRTAIGEGNGIHLWYSNDVHVDDTSVSRFLDGIYLSFAHRTYVRHCRLHDNGRYGLHTMYCQQNLLAGNLFTRNVAGCAIMFSNHLRIENNDVLHNRGSRTYGFLLRDCSDGSFVNNRMVDNTIAMFMDNSNRNELRRNLFQDNGWGLLMFSSCNGNVVAGNNFINDDYAVALDMRRTDNRFDDGASGNFWSDNAPYDLDGDRRSDVPYSPVGAFAFLSKQYPDLAILAKSPAVAALSVAERVIPAMRPSEVVDRFPLLEPVAVSGMGESAGVARDATPAWTSLLAFAGLALLGVGGLRSGWRAR
jgi:nitrous oxidase accessory protein